MSHKQKKAERKLFPHLHPHYKRERRRLQAETLQKAVIARREAMNTPEAKARTAKARGSLMAMAAFAAGALARPEPRKVPADKGLYKGACNRIDCLGYPATWYNSSTQAHYCITCAKAINRWLPQSTPLCTPVEEKSDV
jgi:hypothetical protein